MDVLVTLWSASLLLCLSGVVALLLLIVVRVFSARTARSRERVRRRLIPLLLGGERDAQRLAGAELRFATNLTVELAEFTRGTDRAELLAVATALGVPDLLNKRARSRTAQDRLTAIEALALFDDHAGAVEHALDDSNPHVRLGADLALSARGEAPDLLQLARKLQIGDVENSLLLISLMGDIAEHDPAAVRTLLTDASVPDAAGIQRRTQHCRKRTVVAGAAISRFRSRRRQRRLAGRDTGDACRELRTAQGRTLCRRSGRACALRGFYASPTVPRLLVVDKENGGKADAGRISEIHLPKNFLVLVRIMEYLRAFLMARLALGKMQALMVISGAFGLFDRQRVVEVGGYSHGTVGEDMELVFKLHRHMRDFALPYRVEFIAEPVCWTECPDDIRILSRQRARLQRGSLECFDKHKDMAFNPRYGRIGIVGFGQILLVDVIGPLVEVLGYSLIPVLWALGLLALPWLLAFLAVTFALGIFVSMATLVLEEIQLRRFTKARELIVLALIAVVENFGYRQLSNYWRLQGWWQFMRKQQGWGTMTRKGFWTS